MEQALISCFGEMADERTDMQISCAGKNNPRRLHMQTSTIAPASEADLRMGLALKMPEWKAHHKKLGAKLRQFSPKPSREVLVKSRPDQGRSPAGLRTHRLTGAGKSNPFSYLPSLPVPLGWNSVGAKGPPDGVRSCLPLRGSSGFTPDSLLRCHTTLNIGGKPAIGT